MTELPAFSEFIKQFDMNKLSYDLNSFAVEELTQPTSLFTQEQYSFMASSCTAIFLSLLQAYHQWLSEQIK